MTRPIQLTANERHQLEAALTILHWVKSVTNTDAPAGDITHLTAKLAIDAINYIINQANKATDL